MASGSPSLARRPPVLRRPSAFPRFFESPVTGGGGTSGLLLQDRFQPRRRSALFGWQERLRCAHPDELGTAVELTRDPHRGAFTTKNRRADDVEDAAKSAPSSGAPRET